MRRGGGGGNYNIPVKPENCLTMEGFPNLTSTLKHGKTPILRCEMHGGGTKVRPVDADTDRVAMAINYGLHMEAILGGCGMTQYPFAASWLWCLN